MKKIMVLSFVGMCLVKDARAATQDADIQVGGSVSTSSPRAGFLSLEEINRVKDAIEVLKGQEAEFTRIRTAFCERLKEPRNEVQEAKEGRNKVRADRKVLKTLYELGTAMLSMLDSITDSMAFNGNDPLRQELKSYADRVRWVCKAYMSCKQEKSKEDKAKFAIELERLLLSNWDNI